VCICIKTLAYKLISKYRDLYFLQILKCQKIEKGKKENFEENEFRSPICQSTAKVLMYFIISSTWYNVTRCVRVNCLRVYRVCVHQKIDRFIYWKKWGIKKPEISRITGTVYLCARARACECICVRAYVWISLSSNWTYKSVKTNLQLQANRSANN